MHVLDTTVLLGGRERPPGPCATTPEAAAEITPGGRDARRLASWLAAGLEIRHASAASRARVEAAARAAGNLARLSPADVSVLALALDSGGRLVSDDHTVLDVARRLGVDAISLGTPGVQGTLDWGLRCTGCGRWCDAPGDCPVCGSAVRPRLRGAAREGR